MHYFDSYAIIEMGKGNRNYERFQSETIYTTVFNLAEFFYSALSEHGEGTARAKLAELNADKIEIHDEDIVQACKLRLENKKKNLSYADCMGYVVAKRNSLLFLTGDRQFEGMENVEFVK